MNNSYHKLSDGTTWGVKVFGDVLPGDRVTITTKDGKQRHEIIDEVISCGPGYGGQTVSICSTKKRDRNQSSQSTGEVCPTCKRPF